MRKLLFIIAMFIVSCASAWANQSARGWCELGGQPVVLSGLQSVTQVQASYVGCTVTVNVVGGGLATIFSDNANTPLSNPFTASGAGLWQFYAANGHYSVTMSGAGMPSPVTYSDVLLNDATTASSYVATFFASAVTPTAASGVLRLASNDVGPCWRNNANTA